MLEGNGRMDRLTLGGKGLRRRESSPANMAYLLNRNLQTYCFTMLRGFSEPVTVSGGANVKVTGTVSEPSLTQD